MSDEEKRCYELVKHNSRNPDPATTTIVGTVRGLDRAQRAVDVLDDRLQPDEREAGFSHFFQEGKKPVDRKDRRPFDRWPLGKLRAPKAGKGKFKPSTSPPRRRGKP